MLATFFQSILAVVFILTALLLIGLVLLQKNRGSGLSGAFGGVGGHSAFGTKTGDFLTWVTVGMTAFLLLLAVVANYAFQPQRSAQEMGLTAPPGGSDTAPPPTPALPAGTPAGQKPVAVQTGGSSAAPAKPAPSAGSGSPAAPAAGGSSTAVPPATPPAAAPAGGAPAGSTADHPKP
ncbi:MAG: preprotein translocase subunit SecG [Phycisphaerae bacterium]